MGRNAFWRAGLSLASLMLVVMAAGCGTAQALIPSPTPAPTLAEPAALTVVCPDSLEPVIRAAASTYQREHPELDITVIVRADTLAAEALRRGEGDVALLTWLPDTLSEGAWVRPVSRDGLAVVVNPQNGVPGLTMTQLQDLYQGRLEDWASWGGLPGSPQLISRETASGDAAFFQAWVMRDARVSLNALLAPSTDAVLQFVMEDQLAIGYLSSAWVDSQVRVVPINGVPPAKETLEAGLYPMTRTQFVATAAEPEEPSRGFVQWLLEPPGQSVFEAHGFVAAPE
ncbi:MAG: substrate-binding domain-containing protein [Anaerolineae bacterium]